MIIKIRPRKDRGKVECDYTDPRDGRRYRRVFDTESEAHDHAKTMASPSGPTRASSSSSPTTSSRHSGPA